MLKLILLLLIISFVPVFAQESTSTNRTNELQNQVNELTIQLNELKNHNMDLDTHIGELENKITNLEEHGIKFGIDEIELGRSIAEYQKPDNDWHYGDLLLSSSTIIGFFGFSSFVIIKFQNNTKIPEKLRMLKVFFTTIGIVIVLHIMGILIILFVSDNTSLIINQVVIIAYSYIFIFTAISFLKALTMIFRVVSAENELEQDEVSGENIVQSLTKALKK